MLQSASLLAAALLGACSNDDGLLKTSAGYPPVDLAASGLPSYAVGDSFTFDNPAETWTVTAVHDGLVSWRSSLGETKKTVFDPFVPPIEWTGKSGSTSERLTKWDKGIFPLDGGKETVLDSVRRTPGKADTTPFERKCYVAKPRLVTVRAGAFPAYPVFCRRSDGLTEQSFYAPKVHAMLLITGRKRPAPATTRELVSYKLAPGARITAADVKGIPKGWALAALDRPAPEQETSPLTAVAAAEAIPPISTDTAPNSQGGGIAAPTVPKIEGRPQPPPAATAPQHRPEGQIVADTPSIPAPPAVAPPVIAVPPSIAPPAPASPTADRVAPPAPTTAEPVPSIAAPTMEHPPTIAAGPIKAPPATSHPTVGHPPNTAAPSSGYGVQLASYSKSDSARTAWRTLQRQLKPLLDAVPFTIRRADLGPPKGVVHRVIAGPFPDRSQARALCRSIKARGGTCFVWGFNG